MEFGGYKPPKCMASNPPNEVERHNKRWLHFANNQLMLIHEREAAKSNNKIQENYFKTQEGRLISRPHVDSASSVKAFILVEDDIVIVKVNKVVFPAKIVDTTSNQIQISRIYQDQRQRRMHIDFSDIIWKKEEVEKAVEALRLVGHSRLGTERYFRDPRSYLEPAPYFDQALHTVIQKGHYVELQLPECPILIVIGQVIRNQRGLLLVKYLNRHRWIHCLDPYIHQVGYLQFREDFMDECPQKYTYHPSVEKLPDKSECVPEFVFSFNFTLRHRCLDDDIIVMADKYHNNFYLAHIVTRKGEREECYFFLKVGNSFVKGANKQREEFHFHHPRLFSYKMCKEYGVNIRVPDDLKVNVNESNVMAYRRLYCRGEGRILDGKVGLTHWYTKMTKKMGERSYRAALSQIETLKYVEILRPKKNGLTVMCAAEIVGYKEFMLKTMVCGEEDPVYMHIGDPNIFHLGACIDMGIAIDFNEFGFDVKPKINKKTRTALTAFSQF